MKVSRTRRLVFRMGPYESLETSATIEVEVDDMTDLDQVGPEIDAQLDLLIATDVADAAYETADKDSFAIPYIKQIESRSITS